MTEMITVKIKPRGDIPNATVTEVLIEEDGQHYLTRYNFFMQDTEDNRLQEAAIFAKRRHGHFYMP